MALSFQSCYLVSVIFLLIYYLLRNKNNYNSLCLLEIFALLADGIGRTILTRVDSLGMAVMACKIQYVGALLIPLIWVFLLSRLCDIHLPSALTWGMIGTTVVIFGCVLTIGFSPLYYKSVSLGFENGHTFLIKEYGPMHRAYIALMVVYFLIIASLAVCAIRKRKNVPYKAISFSCCVGCLTIIFYIAEKILGITLAWKPIIYILVGIPMLVASDTLNMFDMSVCIASAVDRMNEYGYIVFDRKCRFISANQFAKNLFPEIQHWNVERSVPAEKTNAYRYIASCLVSATSEAENRNTLEINGQYLEITFRYMYYRSKKPVGYLIELMDKTEEYQHVHTVQEYNALLEKQVAETEAARQAAEKAREEADRANHAKSDFLSRMSHDIRTPINGIFGMLHIMEASLDDKERVRSGLENIKSASQQLSVLLNDILDISRLESGKVQLVQEPFNLPQLLDACIPSVQVLAEAKGVTVKPIQYSCTNQTVVGSPVFLQRIVMNILTNSIKYNRLDGTVSISCRETMTDRNHSIFEFAVRDTGIGMTQEFLSKIYDPFERAAVTAGSSYEGTGLGMAITKDLVELMQGTIDIQSELGEGTTVVIQIPMEICLEEIKEEAVSADVLSGARALVAEDNAMNREYISFVLKEYGIILDVVSDGKKALDQFCSAGTDAYDFILLDMKMPRMSGLEAARAIRALSGKYAKTVPILALTANSFKQDIQDCMNAGMNDHIAKPMDTEELIAKLVKYRHAKTGEALQK